LFRGTGPETIGVTAKSNAPERCLGGIVEEHALRGEELAVLLILIMVIAGLAVLWMAMANRRKLLEMAHRERIAMIERGMVPPPEVDPAGFERRVLGLRPASRSSARFRGAGVLMVGLGLGLMVLISFAGGAPGPGIGVGGSLALVGLAFMLNGLFSARDEIAPGPDSGTPRLAEPREPPPNVAP
jgi:hypothetical protein